MSFRRVLGGVGGQDLTSGRFRHQCREKHSAHHLLEFKEKRRKLPSNGCTPVSSVINNWIGYSPLKKERKKRALRSWETWLLGPVSPRIHTSPQTWWTVFTHSGSVIEYVDKGQFLGTCAIDWVHSVHLDRTKTLYVWLSKLGLLNYLSYSSWHVFLE